MTSPRPRLSGLRRRVALAASSCVLCVSIPAAAEGSVITYDEITEPILSASFTADFAAFTAHRLVGGFEVNFASLVDMSGVLPDFSLSDALFGLTDALADAASIDQGPLGTGLFTVPVGASFFPVLASGTVGVLATFTDTDDGLFAIDFLSLTIVTATRTTRAFVDGNNGFGIGLADGGVLPAPLPVSILFGATGTGFDETVTSVSLRPQPIAEPASLFLLATGAGAVMLRRWRERGTSNDVP